MSHEQRASPEPWAAGAGLAATDARGAVELAPIGRPWRWHILVFLAFWALPAWTSAQAPPAKAAACTACHGEGGRSTITTNPILAGQTALEYAEAMTFTDRKVTEDLFARVRAHFSEPEIVELTAAIALENFRSKFNVALGIEAQGFCLIK